MMHAPARCVMTPPTCARGETKVCNECSLSALRTGHGQALLAFLYDLARSRESVFEITVEDPAPGFEKVGLF